MLWSRRVRQEVDGVGQVGETGESCCGIGRQEGGCVVVWRRCKEGQDEGDLMVWSRWVRQERVVVYRVGRQEGGCVVV
jgi:hypothetical protein